MSTKIDMNILAKNKNIIRLVTFTVIAVFLCENTVWAGGGLQQGDKLAGESAFKRVEKYLSRQGDVALTFNDKLALAAILKGLNEAAFANNRVILRKIEEINRALSDTNIRLEEAVHEEVLSNGQTIDAVVVTINGRRWRRIYLNYKKLGKPQLEEIGIKTEEDLDWLKVLGTERVWLERKGLRPQWVKVSDVIRFMPEDYGSLTVVREVTYNGERYIAKSARSIESEVRFIIPQADILLYLNKLDIPGIPIARHFIELEDGRMAILFDKFPPGKTLKEKGVVLPGEALDIILKVSDIVKKLHEAGVWHWDIKPSNVWITDTGEVILFDLDLAFRTKEEFIRRELHKFSTPLYCSMDRTFETRVSDEVYSLGVTLLDILIGLGEYELDNDDPQSFADRQLSRLQSDPAISSGLKRVLEKALSGGRSKYKTVDEFIQALENVRKGQYFNKLDTPLQEKLSIWQEEIDSFTPVQREIFQRTLRIKGKKIAFDIEGTIRTGFYETDVPEALLYTPWAMPLLIGLLANNKLMIITAAGKRMIDYIQQQDKFLDKLVKQAQIPIYCKEDIFRRLLDNEELFKDILKGAFGTGRLVFALINRFAFVKTYYLNRCWHMKLPELFGFDFLVDDRDLYEMSGKRKDLTRFLSRRYGVGLVPDWLIRVPEYEGAPYNDSVIRKQALVILKKLEGGYFNKLDKQIREKLSLWQEEIDDFTPFQREIFQRALGIKDRKIAFDIEGTIRIEFIKIDEMGEMAYTPWARPLLIGLLANNELMIITAGGRDGMVDCIKDEEGFLFKLIEKGRVPLYCREDILERLEKNEPLFNAIFNESGVLTREGFLLKCKQLKLPELFGFDFLVDDRSIFQLADADLTLVNFLFRRYGGSLVPDWLIRVPSYSLGKEGIYFLGLGGEDNAYLDKQTPEPVFDKLIRRTVAPIFERLEGAGPKQIIIQHFWAFETAELWDHTQEEISRMTRNDIFRIMKEAVVKKVRKWLHLLNAQLKPGQVCEILVPYPPPHYAEFMKDKPPKGIDGELVRVTYEDLEPADESLPNEHAKTIVIVDTFSQTIRTKAQNCKDLDEELVLAVDTDIGNLKEYAQELIAELRKLRIDNVRIFAGPGAGLKGQLQKYLGDRKDCIVTAVLKNSNCSLFDDIKDRIKITAVEDSDFHANYIPIIPIIELAIRKTMGEDVADSYRWLTNVRDIKEADGMLIVYLLPRAAPITVDKLKEIYRNEAVVLASA